MKAIRVHAPGGPEALLVEEIADPSPKAGEVLVRAEAIGVNFIEVYFRLGLYKPAGYPFTPGGELAGVVESVGPGVTSLKPGERVVVAGHGRQGGIELAGRTGTYRVDFLPRVQLNIILSDHNLEKTIETIQPWISPGADALCKDQHQY